MLMILVKALSVSLATSFDELPVLFLLYNRHRNQHQRVTLGYFLGTIALIALAGLASLGTILVRNKAAFGLIGLVPVVMGFRMLVHGEDEGEAEEALAHGQRWQGLLTQVVFITLAMGVDDLGVYLPLFMTQAWQITLQMAVVFLLATGLLCYAAYSLTRIKPVSEFIERYERYIVGGIFIGIGVSVIVETGSLNWIISLIGT
jgi:cadmium resistance transport/sequestration family protein